MGEKLKTIKDLMEMKNQKTPVFENAYNYLLETMRNNLISKVDGERRNEILLSDYDKNAQAHLRKLI